MPQRLLAAVALLPGLHGLARLCTPACLVDGRDFPSLGINMASREDVGGDGDGVEWVMLSRDFQD